MALVPCAARPRPFCGGGIVNHGDLLLSRCTVAKCLSLGAGGGIYNDGTLTLINSTVAGNLAGFSGGGIHNEGGSVALVHTTVTDNESFFAEGGGILNASGGVSIENSVVPAIGPTTDRTTSSAP